jgi:hypothetical protein
MEMKRFAAGLATAGLLGMGGFGVGLGVAQADPHTPPNPGNSDHGNSGQGNPDSGGPADRPDTVTGPGVNAGTPGNPLPPGLGYLPPPGHGGPMPQDRITFPTVPDWVIHQIEPPLGSPPKPLPDQLPDWATGLTVVWNPDLGAWGVWNPDTDTFVRL